MTRESFKIAFAIISLLTVSATFGANSIYSQVTIGADVAPQATLDIIGDTARTKGNAFRMIDGNQQNGYVLTTDANGKATWKPTVTPSFYGTFQQETAGVGIYKTSMGNNVFKATKAYIDLPQGNWKVDITLLASGNYYTSTVDTTKVWLRTTFSSDTTTTTLNNFQYNSRTEIGRGNGIPTSRLVSGVVSGCYRYNILTGNIIIRNTNTAPTTRYFLIYNVNEIILGQSDPTYLMFRAFASSQWSENSITAIPINL